MNIHTVHVKLVYATISNLYTLIQQSYVTLFVHLVIYQPLLQTKRYNLLSLNHVIILVRPRLFMLIFCFYNKHVLRLLVYFFILRCFLIVRAYTCTRLESMQQLENKFEEMSVSSILFYWFLFFILIYIFQNINFFLKIFKKIKGLNIEQVPEQFYLIFLV